jgi:hypothetical protein
MEKKPNSKLEKEIDWYLNEIEKDKKDLELQKESFIENIKKFNKEDLLPKKPQKLTIWQKIRKSLMGY